MSLTNVLWILAAACCVVYLALRLWGEDPWPFALVALGCFALAMVREIDGKRS